MPNRVLVLLCSLACSYVYAQTPSDSVRRFVSAFNHRHLDTMLQLSAKDMKWMSVSGENITIETNTHEQFEAAMKSYFSALPSAQSSIESLDVSGSFVYTRERASWQSQGETKSQCSVAVYEIDAQLLIQNVWYYPSFEC